MVADWQAERLHADAIAVEVELPKPDVKVLAWVSDAAVAIHFFPVVAWLSAGRWWSGVPAKYIDLGAARWTVTHWKPLAP